MIAMEKTRLEVTPLEPLMVKALAPGPWMVTLAVTFNWPWLSVMSEPE